MSVPKDEPVDTLFTICLSFLIAGIWETHSGYKVQMHA